MDGLVTMVKTADSSDPDNQVSHYRYGAAPGKAAPWNISGARAEAVSEGRLPGSTVHENGGRRLDGPGLLSPVCHKEGGVGWLRVRSSKSTNTQ
jgi:hypothetical protein